MYSRWNELEEGRIVLNFQGRIADGVFIVVEKFHAVNVFIPFQAIIFVS